jgi:dCMP deaminase
MQIAGCHAELSKAKRKKVGACLVTKTGVCLTGYNGTPHGADNDCEDAQGSTKQSVIHAELNCILKAAKEGVSIQGSILYVTLSPCLQCAAMLVQAGVTQVIYLEEYRDTSGIQFLRNSGINVYHFDDIMKDII